MVYSGYTLIYGIHFHTTDHLLQFLGKFCYGTSLKALIEQLKNHEDEHHEQEDLIDKFLNSEGYEAMVHRKRCCYDDGSWYFGYLLGSTDFVYRDSVDEFPTFDKYSSDMHDQLDRIEKEWVSKQTQIRKELRSIRTLFDASCAEGDLWEQWDGDLDMALAFYKYANDCESCS